MKRGIKSGDNDTSTSTRMWHHGVYQKNGTTLFSIVHPRSVVVTKFSSSHTILQYYTPFFKKIPPVILSILGFVHFNISINYLHEEWMFHLIISGDDRNLGGIANTANDRIKI